MSWTEQEKFHYYDEKAFKDLAGQTNEAVVEVLNSSKVVVAYQDGNDGNRGKAKIGTLDGTTIVSFGSESQFGTGIVVSIQIASFSESGFVVIYKDINGANHGTAQFGTVSGTTIIFGAESEFNSSGTTDHMSITTISESGFVVAYRDSADSNHGTAKFGTISGTTITFGPETEFTTYALWTSVAAFSSSGFVVVYQDFADSNHGTAKFGTINGTTITFGNEAEFLADKVTHNEVTILDSSGFIIAYRDVNIGNYPYGIYGRVSGTNIVFGTGQEITSSAVDFISVTTLDSSTVVAVFDRTGNLQGQSRIGHISGTTFTWDELVTGNTGTYIDPGPGNRPDIATISSTHFIVVFEDQPNGSRGTVRIGILTFANATDLFITGQDEHNVSGDLYINSHKSVLVSGDLYVNGYELISASGDLYINGYEFISASGDLYVNSHKSILASGDLYINSYGSISVSGDLFQEGYEPTQSSGDLFIIGNENIFLSGNLFIIGNEDIFSSGDLYIIGNKNTLSSNDLFIIGNENITSSNDLFIHGHSPTNNSVDLFMHGREDENGSINMCIFVVGCISGIPIPSLFIHGHETINTSGDLFVSGSGITPYSGNVNLFINGVQPKPALACPTLDVTAAIQIKDSLITTYQVHIDALINQLGKNVYLEFDPIFSPCPNCTYDTIRKRSTGIYIPGGPRPFKRGRRCPYCKGKGLLETAVNKCIKCLIQWNPSDVVNFGISVSQKKGIVRLKTYLTEADDLARARTVIVNHDIVGQMKLRVKLIQGPIPVGLREDRYCISFWELI